MNLPGTTTLLVLAAATSVLLQIAIVAAAALRMGLDDRRLRRAMRRHRLLAALYDELEAQKSPSLRRTLADRRLRRDLQTLEGWLDLVSERRHDPAGVQAADYEASGLVARHLEILESDRRWSRRAAAAAVLGWSGSPEATAPLLRCAQDTATECPTVRQVALRALARIRDPRAVTPLVEALISGETWLPPILAGVLTRIGEPSVEPVVELLLDRRKPSSARRWAARILGDLRDRRALHALHRTLDSNDPELRSQAAVALGSIADERSVDRLLSRLLVDPVPFVRTAVAKALGEIAAERTVHFLVEGLSDPEWWVRLRVVEALEQIGEAARDVLVTALHDRDPQVAREAARALEGQGVVDGALASLRGSSYDPSNAEFLIDVGRAGNVEPLLDELRSEDPSHLRMIVRILARIESPATGEALAELLRRPLGPKLRARVVDALLRVRDGSHVDVVLPYLEHDDPWVRKTAVDYLGAFADPSVMPGVLLRVQDSEEWTREAALRVVERLQEGSEVPEAVRERLRDRFPFVRAAAVRVFCAARDFQTLLDDEVTEELAEPSVRRAFLEGMRHRANATSLPLLLRISAFSGDTDLPRLEDLAREVFASMEPAEVQAELERACERPAQPSQRWLAATALPFVPAADRAARLEGFVGDSDPRVRAAAIAGMAATSADHGLATATVIAALQDPAPLVVKAGILAASWSGQDALRSSLRRCLRHADPSVRRDAALAAGFVDDARMTSALRSTSLDREPGPRVAGVLARLHLGQRDAMADWIEILRDDALREEFESLLEQDHRILRRLLAAHRPEEQEWVGRLMGCRTPFEAERALLEALDTSRDENLRTMAVDGLERLDTERAHGRIVSSLLKDQSPRVRARALRYVVERNVFDRREHFLREALRDPVETVQVQAVHLCICLEERVAVSLLSQHLGTRRRRLRAAVSDLLAGYLAEDLEWAMDFLLGQEATEEFLTGLVETLAKVAVPLTTELLELLFLHRRAHTRAHALRALLPRLAQGRWPHIRRALDDPSPTVRLEALRHLGRQEVDDPSLRDELHGLLDRLRQDPSPALRARVALVLGAHDIEGSERWLAELARDPHARVARAGQKAQQRRRDEPVGVSS